eukprot:SAG31_NODE_5478_length_2515_cov_38.661424_4_plen_98_part_00
MSHDDIIDACLDSIRPAESLRALIVRASMEKKLETKQMDLNDLQEKAAQCGVVRTIADARLIQLLNCANNSGLHVPFCLSYSLMLTSARVFVNAATI